MQPSGPELVFVYNAGSSVAARAFDFFHKALSPKTYACNLCRVTYGVFAEKQEWRQFVEGLPWRSTFLHRDEFRERHPELAGTPLPAVFLIESGAGGKLIASAEEINRARRVQDLKALIARRAGQPSRAPASASTS